MSKWPQLEELQVHGNRRQKYFLFFTFPPIGNKVLVITKKAFWTHGTKPAVFDRLMSQCPQFWQYCWEYAKKQELFQLLPAGNGATSSKVRPSPRWCLLLPSHHYIKQRKVSADEYEAYLQIISCDFSLKKTIWPYVSHWMYHLAYTPNRNLNTAHEILQTEVTLIENFFAEKWWGFCTRWPHIRTAFNACSYLMFLWWKH